MAKFGNSSIDDGIPLEKQDIVIPSKVNPQPIENVSINIGTAPVAPTPQQSNSAAAVIQAETDSTIVDYNINKQEEHWVKAYWRPAMGWLYMLICFMDFVAFPLIAMFLPVVLKGFGIQLQYVAWQSLSLSNGGLIHMAFGAILGVAAWTRGQEKVAIVNK